MYGADAAFWGPGRWIEASENKRKGMERALFAVRSSEIQTIRRLRPNLSRNTDVESISLEEDQESALEKTSRIWRCIRSSLNC